MSKKFKVKTDCGNIIEYDTAYELGYIVGARGLKMHNQYEPIHKESEEYNEGRFDGKSAREKQKMTKRESGWYRVWDKNYCKWELLKFDAESNLWTVGDDCFSDSTLLLAGDVIDPKMVMTLSGEIVYHRNEHNPLYNTQQDG